MVKIWTVAAAAVKAALLVAAAAPSSTFEQRDVTIAAGGVPCGWCSR